MSNSRKLFGVRLWDCIVSLLDKTMKLKMTIFSLLITCVSVSSYGDWCEETLIPPTPAVVNDLKTRGYKKWVIKPTTPVQIIKFPAMYRTDGKDEVSFSYNTEDISISLGFDPTIWPDITEASIKNSLKNIHLWLNFPEYNTSSSEFENYHKSDIKNGQPDNEGFILTITKVSGNVIYGTISGHINQVTENTKEPGVRVDPIPANMNIEVEFAIPYEVDMKFEEKLKTDIKNFEDTQNQN